jgi:hypothetical protein
MQNAPLLASKHEHGVVACGRSPTDLKSNRALSNSILEMSIHLAESKMLVACLTLLLPGIVSKLSVITVIL